MFLEESAFICPLCKQKLFKVNNSLKCLGSHSFDFAKQGYVNLLMSNASGKRHGDDRLMVEARSRFLNKGYYDALRQTASTILGADNIVLDAGCGEGYYTSALGANPALKMFGFDISREMVRLAAKRGNGTYFVANMASIPVADASMDYAIHLFAPFQERSFSQALRPGGHLFTVVPGRFHLWELKQTLYETPYENDEMLPATDQLVPVSCHKVSARICLASQEDIQAVFRMILYYFRTYASDKEKLLSLERLETQIEFVIGEYRKP